MIIRKLADYSALFAALGAVITANMPQMELYCEIGRLVSIRTEKGAAVAASEYLQTTRPTAEGFSRAMCAECGTSTGCTAICQN